MIMSTHALLSVLCLVAAAAVAGQGDGVHPTYLSFQQSKDVELSRYVADGMYNEQQTHAAAKSAPWKHTSQRAATVAATVGNAQAISSLHSANNMPFSSYKSSDVVRDRMQHASPDATAAAAHSSHSSRHWFLQSPASSIARILQQLLSPASGGGSSSQQMPTSDSQMPMAGAAGYADEAIKEPTMDPSQMFNGEADEADSSTTASGNTAIALAAEAANSAAAGGDDLSLTRNVLQNAIPVAAAQGGDNLGGSSLPMAAMLSNPPNEAYGLNQQRQQQQQQQQQQPGSLNSSNLNTTRLMPFPALPQSTASNGSSSSGGGRGNASPLRTVLQGIASSWQQRRSLGTCPSVENGNIDGSQCRQVLEMTWQREMQQMAQQRPELAAFAQLAGQHPLLLSMISSTGLPAVLLAPSNTAVEAMLKKQQEEAATMTNDTSQRMNGTWQQWVADAQQAPAESLLFLLRHIIPVRQPQLLDSSGEVSRQLLGKVMAGDIEGDEQQGGLGQDDLLVFNSLVLQTALGSYVQVSELPDAPSAYRLELAAAAAVVASSRNGSANITLPSPQNLGAYSLTQQQLLLARRNASRDPEDNSTASVISHLHVGAHLRALDQPQQLNITRLMVVGLNGVLKESDEVINGGTAAQLRGAFGWSPEDEQSMLSRIYLDPESTYWARTLQVPDKRGMPTGRFGMSNAPTSPGSNNAPSGNAVSPADAANSAIAAAAEGAAVAQQMQQPGGGSGGGGNRGGGGRKLKQQPPQQQQQQQQQQSGSGTSDGQSGGSSSSSGSNQQSHSVSTSPMPVSGTTSAANAQVSSSSSVGATNLTSGNSSSATAAAVPGSNRAAPPSNRNAAAASAALARPSAPLLSPSAIAELIARQQQQSMEMRMADALAANLMITEALSAWTVAAVTQPAAVFAPLNIEDLKFKDGKLDPNQLSGDVSRGNQCLVDWGSPCGMPWGCIKTGSSSGSSNSTCTRCCYLGPATANTSSSTVDPFRLPTNNSMMSNICPLNAAAAAAAVGSSSSISPGRCSGWQHQEQSGMLQPAALVGLSPYQLYPSLGLLDAAYDMSFSGPSDSGNAQSPLPMQQQAAGNASATAADVVTAAQGQNSSNNGRRLMQTGVSNAEPGTGGAPPPWQPLSAASRQQQPDAGTPAAAAAAAAPGGAQSAAPTAGTGATPAAPQAAAAAPQTAPSAGATPAAAPQAAPSSSGAAPVAGSQQQVAAAGAAPSQSAPATQGINATAAVQAAAAAAAASGNRPPTPLHQRLGSNNSESKLTITTANTTTAAAGSSSSSTPASPPQVQQPAASPDVSHSSPATTGSDEQAAAAHVGALPATAPPPAAAAATAAAAPVGDGEGVWVRVPTDQLSYLTVMELSGLLAEGRVTPAQLAELFTARLERYNNLLHATVTFTIGLAAEQSTVALQALRDNNVTTAAPAPPVKQATPPPPSRGLLQASPSAAAAAEGANASANARPTPAAAAAAGSSPSVQPDPQASASQAQKDSRLSLLTGIPYGLKDLFAVPGYPTAWGLTALQNRTINTPSWPFSALSGASGAVLLAKTATGELAWGDVFFDDITTRNPWNVNTGSCGSSAGSAVAVAAGLLPFAVGSETWGSIVCPATTVGVTAFRPTGGSIPSHGLMQVSSTLDKTGIFCRQALDCAVVADALMDKGFSSSSSSIVTNTSTILNSARLHRQNARQASTFNYSAHQEAQQALPAAQRQQTWKPNSSGTLFPPTFQQLPSIATTCIGFLEGASDHVLDAIASLKPGCIKGPLPPPGNNNMVRDILSVILQVDVSVSLEGLWLEGYISQKNHWYPLIQLGQVSPAAAYVKAQRLRSVLLSQVKAYYAAYGVQVLLKPAKSDVGTDGLATLLDMPELLLPVGFTVAAQEAESADDSPQMESKSEQVWLQPDVNSLVALPGHDAQVIAVAAAFQSVTAHHLVHPSLPAV